jgi:hypothetical protein
VGLLTCTRRKIQKKIKNFITLGKPLPGEKYVPVNKKRKEEK